MGRVKQAGSDEAYLGDAWAWAGELARTHNVGVRVVLLPTGRPGCWDIRLEAVEVADRRAVGVKAQVVSTYPDASPVTLAGRLYAMAVQLDRKLSDPLADIRPTPA